MSKEPTSTASDATPCSFSRRALAEIKIELFDLQSRVTTGNVFKFLILLTLLGIWGTLLFVK